jgi:hypothetical protein
MKSILGDSWKTSLVGAILAGLTVYQEYLKTGSVSNSQIAIAVAIAILGRLMADATKENNGQPQ